MRRFILWSARAHEKQWRDHPYRTVILLFLSLTLRNYVNALLQRLAYQKGAAEGYAKARQELRTATTDWPTFARAHGAITRDHPDEVSWRR